MSGAYLEIVIAGGDQGVKSLIASTAPALGADADRIFLSSEIGISAESRLQKVLEAIGLVEDRTHVLLPAAVFPVFQKAIHESGGLEVRAAHEIVDAKFDFSFECFNEAHSETIGKIFSELPEGVNLDGYEPETVRDREASDSELYTPVHAFEFRGRGEARGSIEGLIRLRRTAETDPLIETGEIHIVLGANVVLNSGD